MNKRITCTMVLLFLLFAVILPLRAEAAYPALLSASHPITGYPLSRKKDVILYKDAKRTKEIIRVGYREFSIVKYDAVNKSFCVCVTEKGRKVWGWVKRSTFLFSQKFPSAQSFANGNMKLYKGKSTSMFYKNVPLYTGGATIGESGQWYQMLFYMNKRYYLGWVPKSDYKTVRLSMDTTEQPLANGNYRIQSRAKTGCALTSNAENGTVRLEKTSAKSEQIFTLTYVADNQYTIQPSGKEKYLGLKNGKLALIDKKTYWVFVRYGRYFALKEAESGRGICFISGRGILERNFARTNSGQDWIFVKSTVGNEEKTNTVFSQYDPKWGGSIYSQGNPVRTLSSSGCGVVSYVNAVYALNGEYIDPVMLGEFSNSNGHYIYMQGTSDTLYQDFARRKGKYYHFQWDGKTFSIEALRKHLRKGGTAVALVPGHYIAIVDYRASDQSYLILDSAVTGKRATTIYGDWVKEEALRTGNLYCSYFHLFSKKY